MQVRPSAQRGASVDSSSKVVADGAGCLRQLGAGHAPDRSGIRALQEAGGNAAVARLMRDRHDSAAPSLQAKLVVGAANDPLEREADRLAAQVLRTWSLSARVSRESIEAGLRRLAVPGGDFASSFEADAAVAERLKARRGAGHALPGAIRDRMEAGFGADFHSVRIHRDTESAAISTGLAARAFTHGSDIYFGPGAYDPASSSGRHLLAHELTHVVQQTGLGRVSRQTGLDQHWLMSARKGLQLQGSLGNPRLSYVLDPARSVSQHPIIQRQLSHDPVAHPNNQDIHQGLIHGTYQAGANTADLHVAAGGGNQHLTAADMLTVAEDLEQAMRQRLAAGGPPGRISLHPTGAAIVKIVVEMLGEALGGWMGKMAARWKKLMRAQPTGVRSPDRLDQNVLPEHFAYLESLRGSNRVSIKPRIMSQNPAHRPTLADYDQDMMATTAAGDAKYAKYKAQAEDLNEAMGSSLDIDIGADQLPDVIALLRTRH